MYEEYAQIEAAEKEIKKKKEALRGKILQDMIEKGINKESHFLGSFSITLLKDWTYPEAVTKMEEKYKALKAKSESTGEATYVEKESLRFTATKF